MALPTNVTTARITGKFTDAAGNPPPGGGTVTFTPTDTLRDTTAGGYQTLLPTDIVCQLRVADGVMLGPDGNPGVVLMATDDADLSPAGWLWQVQFQFYDADGNTTWQDSYNIDVLSSWSSSGQDLAQIDPDQANDDQDPDADG